jgi:hypothetical protein
VTNIIKRVTTQRTFLIHFPPFTGKTSLPQLVADHLNKNSCHVYFFDLLEYSPFTNNINNFIEKIIGCNVKDIRSRSNNGDPVYLIFDEFQKLYSITPEQVEKMYRVEDPSEQQIADCHSEFVTGGFKSLSSNQEVAILCFASYGDLLISECNTPFRFKDITSEYGYFTEDEVDDLLRDFKERTQIEWIKTKRELPSFLKEFISKMTYYHVGYTSAILGKINIQKKENESEMKLFTYIILVKLLRT